MHRPLATSAIALILAAGPALADVTPNEVWQSLRDSYQDMGYRVDVGSEEGSGDMLTLTDVTLTSTEEEAADMVLTMPRIDFTATGDGGVRSVVDGQMTLEMRDTGPEGEEFGFAMTMDAPGNETISTGTVDALQHDFVMPTMVVEGRALDDDSDTPVTATVTNITGVQTVTAGADGSSTQTGQGQAESVEMRISATGPSETADDAQATDDMAPDAAPAEPAPDAGADADATADATPATDSFDATLRIADLTFEGEGTTPAGEVSFGNQPSAALQAGFSGQGSFTMGAITGEFTSDTTAPEGGSTQSNGDFGAAGGTLAVSMSEDGLTYEGSSTDMTANLTSTDMPFPISYAAALNSFRLAMPVVASEDEQPFALRYVLEDLTLDDAIWQAMDPEGALPRDPAGLTIDLEGQTVLTQDFMDPDYAETAAETGPDGEAPMPFLPRSLSIKDVSLNAVGASMNLSGDLTFGDDPRQPVGSIAGSFSGINTLLDTLVTMGVVPQDQLMGPRMMLAMFARPVEGDPDELQTEIEFREGGSIFANGQQIQ